jgi:hypothetical protein
MPKGLSEVVSSDGTLDVRKLWTPTPKNQIIRRSPATNKLRVGGTGSSKSSDALMEVVQNYLLRWDGCHALFLRKNLTELKKSSILDLKEFIPEDLYHWNATDFVATFHATGSKLFFGYLANLSEQDLAQYLSSAFPVIVLDECGQLSGAAWQFLQSRNRVNRECKPNERGEFPKPVMLGCTNPLGPFWGFYHDTFIKKKPWDIDPEAKRAKDGSWWIKRDGKYLCVYNPADYDFIHSTILDNPHLMARDPDLVRKLEALPKDKRDKFLYGELDAVSGQYFDCWEPSVHIITREQIAQSIIWQPWQPRWLGWDWGRVHYGAAVWMTLAQVKQPGGEFRQKVVVYREYVDKGQDYRALANTVSAMTRMGLPGSSKEIQDKSRTLDAIYFSHEKFAIQMESQSPAMLMSGYLTELGLPPARQATRQRTARANLLYDTLKTCGIVILDSCPEVIEAIPQLIRDESNIEDVKKLSTKADDVYDGLSLGLFGKLGRAETPDEVRLAERLDSIEDPLWRRMQQIKATLDRERITKADNIIGADWLLNYEGR